MKGIILAGGSGTRLHPLTLAVSKQLLPVYNKPMIYYPLWVLMLAEIKEILIITTPKDLPLFKSLLGDGSQLGITLSYTTQTVPKGIADAFIISKKFIGNSSVCLILGDNILFGKPLKKLLIEAKLQKKGATLFGYEVQDPKRFGVVEIGEGNKILSIEEKPIHPKSNVAVTGLYFYDNQVVDIATHLKPSARGELEITDINRDYLNRGQAYVHVMGKEFTWLDAGTYLSLMKANQLVQAFEEKRGQYVGAIEEQSYKQGLINKEQLRHQSQKLGNSPYGQYLEELANETP